MFFPGSRVQIPISNKVSLKFSALMLGRVKTKLPGERKKTPTDAITETRGTTEVNLEKMQAKTKVVHERKGHQPLGSSSSYVMAGCYRNSSWQLLSPKACTFQFVGKQTRSQPAWLTGARVRDSRSMELSALMLRRVKTKIPGEREKTLTGPITRS